MNLKQQIIQEIEKQEFPDLKLLFSDEALDISLEILRELLEKEKKEFDELLKLPKEEIEFNSFEDEGDLSYYWSLLNHFQGVNNVEKIRKIVEEFRPGYEDFGNMVAYSKPYFQMLVHCEEKLHNLTPNPSPTSRGEQEDLEEQKRVMYLRIKRFKDRGIDLEESKQERLKEINKELSKLSHDFSNNIVDDESHFEYIMEDYEIIKDLPEDVLSVAKNQAKEKGEKGYLFTADPTAYAAIMRYCSDGEVRKYFEEKRNAFASQGKYDNRKNILQILTLKKERAKLLGFKNYAELSLHNKMAESPKQVMELIGGISKKAKIKAEKELTQLQAYFGLEKIETYDLAYYSRLYKEEKYKINDKVLKQYFEYDSVMTYLHNFVREFLGVELRPLSQSLPSKESEEAHNLVYDENVSVYGVYRDGELISYYLLDPFYRKEKRGGAWADNLREKSYEIKKMGRKDKVPVVVNVCNFLQGERGKTLLNMIDVETIFHEFGHALHEMLSESKHSELSGFGVEWDFVELPSQLLENWVTDRESLEKLGKHFESGEKISDEILDKLDQLKTYMSGAFVARQNELALMDMDLHKSNVPDSIQKLDTRVLDLINKYGIWQRDENYKMYCSFGHIFGGGYAAGYYSYMWAEIIEAQVFERIKKEGMFDRKVGERYVNTILGQGTKKDAKKLFYDFTHEEVSLIAFNKRKGL